MHACIHTFYMHTCVYTYIHPRHLDKHKALRDGQVLERDRTIRHVVCNTVCARANECIKSTGYYLTHTHAQTHTHIGTRARARTHTHTHAHIFSWQLIQGLHSGHLNISILIREPYYGPYTHARTHTHTHTHIQFMPYYSLGVIVFMALVLLNYLTWRHYSPSIKFVLSEPSVRSMRTHI